MQTATIGVRESWTSELRDLFSQVSAELSRAGPGDQILGRVHVLSRSRGRIIIPLIFSSRANRRGFLMMVWRSIAAGDVEEVVLAAEIPHLVRWGQESVEDSGVTRDSGWLFYHERPGGWARQVVCPWNPEGGLVDSPELRGSYEKTGWFVNFFGQALSLRRLLAENLWRSGSVARHW